MNFTFFRNVNLLYHPGIMQFSLLSQMAVLWEISEDLCVPSVLS